MCLQSDSASQALHMLCVTNLSAAPWEGVAILDPQMPKTQVERGTRILVLSLCCCF